MRASHDLSRVAVSFTETESGPQRGLTGPERDGHNLGGAVGRLAGADVENATARTLQRRVFTVPGQMVTSGRRRRPHRAGPAIGGSGL